MKTLYITDLDGTLLDNSAHVSATSAEIISDLSRRGALITVATARTPATVVPLLKDVYTTTDFVVMTGAGLWNRADGRFDHLTTMQRKDVDTITDILEQSGVCPFIYTFNNDGIHLDVYHSSETLNDSERSFYELRKNLELKTFHLGHTLPDDDRNRTVLFFASGSQNAIVSAAEAVRKTCDCYVSYYTDTYTDGVWLLEIFAKGVSKTEGIKILKNRLGVDRIVTFGDNLNDIAMLESADLGVAVGNALPQTKAVADIIIGPNDTDSVARFIAEDFEKNQ